MTALLERTNCAIASNQDCQHTANAIKSDRKSHKSSLVAPTLPLGWQGEQLRAEEKNCLRVGLFTPGARLDCTCPFNQVMDSARYAEKLMVACANKLKSPVNLSSSSSKGVICFQPQRLSTSTSKPKVCFYSNRSPKGIENALASWEKD